MALSGGVSIGITTVVLAVCLLITSIVLLLFTGQTVHYLKPELYYLKGSESTPAVIHIELDYGPQAQYSAVVRLAFWPLVLNLTTGSISLIVVLAAMFFRDCGNAARRSVRSFSTPGRPELTSVSDTNTVWAGSMSPSWSCSARRCLQLRPSSRQSSSIRCSMQMWIRELLNTIGPMIPTSKSHPTCRWSMSNRGVVEGGLLGLTATFATTEGLCASLSYSTSS